VIATTRDATKRVVVGSIIDAFDFAVKAAGECVFQGVWVVVVVGCTLSLLCRACRPRTRS
jgi:hypothetical protein